MNVNRRFLLWVAGILALAPVILYAYLGHFSRIVGDDWCSFADIIWLGNRGSVLNAWNGWSSSYSALILHNVLLPLGPEYLPAVLPAVIIALWLIGLTWLYSHVLRVLQLSRNRYPLAVTLAALTLVAAIKALYTWESIYWYSAVVRHALPLVVFIIYLALLVEFSRRQRSTWRTAGFGLVSALICFTNAGFYELYVVLQFVYLPVFMAGILAYKGTVMRRQFRIIVAAGWVGNLGSLLLQLTSPGLTARMQTTSTWEYTNPISSLPLLLLETIETSFEYIGNQDSLAGFMLTLATGLTLTLLVYHPKTQQSEPRSLTLAAPPLLLGLIVQLLFLPILWAQTSDQGQILESWGFSLNNAMSLNILSILAHLLLIVRRHQLRAWLMRRQQGVMLLSAAVLLAVLALLVLTQAPGIQYMAIAYLFTSALVLLGMLAWVLTSTVPEARAKRFGMIAILSSVLVLSAIALPVAIGHYSLGIVYRRSLTFTALLLVLSGLVWGAYIGFLIQRNSNLTGRDSASPTRLTHVGFVVVAVIVINIVMHQVSLIPNFAIYARDWDLRHQRIVRLRDGGEREIEVSPFGYDMAAYISEVDLPIVGLHCRAYYYKVDSIKAVES